MGHIYHGAWVVLRMWHSIHLTQSAQKHLTKQEHCNQYLFGEPHYVQLTVLSPKMKIATLVWMSIRGQIKSILFISSVITNHKSCLKELENLYNIRPSIGMREELLPKTV